MDKTININIAGILFQIDGEAFIILRDYLHAINTRFKNVSGGLETIEDIESRIAEIFQSQKGLAGVITMENVEAMITIIGQPEDFGQNEVEAESPVYNARKKRMYRNPDDSIISGVCGGIGAYLNIDPVLFRILFILFAVMFGVGFFVYIALWIALPPANTDVRRREMYGDAYNSVRSHTRQANGTFSSDATIPVYYNSSRVGNATNEIFRAIGRVFYIALRIILIIFGVAFVLIGFLLILSFFMILVLKYPGSFSGSGFDMNLVYFSDFLYYIVNPVLVPWITVLTLIALVIPMLALIYWGVKMIFWFRAKDGIFSLIGLVLWVMTLAALAVILFNEGISFAETAKSSNQNILTQPPDTLYIKVNKTSSDIKFDKELSLKEDGYNVFINEDKKELYIRPYLRVMTADNNNARVEIRKRSSGRSESDAMKKTEDLLYNYTLNADTLLIDEYFIIPSGRKWAADNVGINLYLPAGSVVKIDRISEKLFHSETYDENERYYDSISLRSGYSSWILTEDELKPLIKPSVNKK